MSGFNTLWLAGTDHAGIATQMLVERQLASEGTKRADLGREKFVERVWEWRRLYGGNILKQMKRLGDSVDWSREYFTMNENLNRAVREVFVRLWEQGLIYRGEYIVNWCPRCLTAISDLEVVHEEQQGKLYEIRYPLADGSGSIHIATTRPETMLGDVAVAVSPNDERYRELIGKKLRYGLSLTPSIDYFVGSMAGVRTRMGRTDWETFTRNQPMGFRSKPAGVVVDQLGEGGLNLLADCATAASVSQGPFKFTLTSPYMLARTLVDNYYRDFESLTMGIAQVLAMQVSGLDCACVQVDEANVTGNPSDSELAARAINLLLDHVTGERAVHLCFGNYGGQSIQEGTWGKLIGYLNALHVDHVVMETAHRPPEELAVFRDLRPGIGFGLGVVDIKSTEIETADEIARAIERAGKTLGAERIKYIHPDCGFWMLKRNIADGKIRALVDGRNLHQGSLK